MAPLPLHRGDPWVHKGASKKKKQNVVTSPLAASGQQALGARGALNRPHPRSGTTVNERGQGRGRGRRGRARGRNDGSAAMGCEPPNPTVRRARSRHWGHGAMEEGKREKGGGRRDGTTKGKAQLALSLPRCIHGCGVRTSRISKPAAHPRWREGGHCQAGARMTDLATHPGCAHPAPLDPHPCGEHAQA